MKKFYPRNINYLRLDPQDFWSIQTPHAGDSFLAVAPAALAEVMDKYRPVFLFETNQGPIATAFPCPGLATRFL